MDEEKIRGYAKYFLLSEIAKIEEVINSKDLPDDEEMILADKLIQYKKEYTYLDKLDEVEDTVFLL